MWLEARYFCGTNHQILKSTHPQQMIQRIQTSYLFLATAVLVGLCFLPLATASGDAAALASTGDNFFADGVYWAKDFPGGMASLIVGGLSLLSIFLYNNRPRQIQLAGVLAFLAVVLTVLFAVLGYLNAQHLPEGAAAHLQLGGALPPTAIVLLLLAHRAIRKDEDLVRSSDRLR